MDPYSIFIAVSFLLISYALQPKPQSPDPASLNDIDVSTANDGDPIGVVFGKPWVKRHNFVWYGDLGAIPIRKKGGKK